ncbi:MAG: hypothetical protein WCI73_00475 [Phycisphaerae bacterium]
MKYTALTRRYAQWLWKYIDRSDWAASYLDGTNYFRNAENWQLERCTGGRRRWPQKLTSTAIQQHLQHDEYKIHYISSRESKTALIAIDIDAHQGQHDAVDAALYIQENYLPSTFVEPTPRGSRLFLLVNVGMMKKVRVNRHLNELQRLLGIIMLNAGFRSIIEVLGGYTLMDQNGGINQRGHTASLPVLFHGEADLHELESLKIHEWVDFKTLYYDAMTVEEEVVEKGDKGEMVEKEAMEAAEAADPAATTASDVQYSLEGYVSWTFPTPISPSTGNFRIVENTDAFDRMVKTCFDFTAVYRRIPSEDELLDSYSSLYGSTTGPSEEADRRRRAKDAVKGRSRTFDEILAQEAGYEHYREQLMEAVKTYAIDRTCQYTAEITDEDLAVGLYLVTRNSFAVADTARQQWTCPTQSFADMFSRLQSVGLTDRGGGNRNKIVAIKTILEQAGLITCIDRGWKHCPDNPKAGLGKKYTIGRNHWRYSEFIRFSQDIAVEYIRTGSPSAVEPVSATAQPVPTAADHGPRPAGWDF